MRKQGPPEKSPGWDKNLEKSAAKTMFFFFFNEEFKHEVS